MSARAGLLVGLMLALAVAQAAPAQDAAPDARDVLVIDQERLFQESLLGQRIARELEQRSAELATENRAIEAELVAEERDLTEQRPKLDPERFRKLADAFDEKVDQLRSSQDAKTRELVAVRDAGRENFTQSVGPILLDYMRRTGASVMLDRRSVVATADRVDVTDEVIAEIDARVRAEGLSPDAGASGQTDEATQPGEAGSDAGGDPASPEAADDAPEPAATGSGNGPARPEGID